MSIKIEISNKWLYSLITISIILIFVLGTWAYENNMNDGTPNIVGHSAGEIHVTNSVGSTEKLQPVLDNLYQEITTLKSRVTSLEQRVASLETGPVTCTMNGNTYSPGAECRSSNCIVHNEYLPIQYYETVCACQNDGTWNCNPDNGADSCHSPC